MKQSWEHDPAIALVSLMSENDLKQRLVNIGQYLIISLNPFGSLKDGNLIYLVNRWKLNNNLNLAVK